METHRRDVNICRPRVQVVRQVDYQRDCSVPYKHAKTMHFFDSQMEKYKVSSLRNGNLFTWKSHTCVHRGGFMKLYA